MGKTAYRCLHSAGFQIAIFNCTIEFSDLQSLQNNGTLRCGLANLPGNLNALPIRLKDIDSNQPVCKILIPEDFHGKSAASWLHSPNDKLEFEVLPP